MSFQEKKNLNCVNLTDQRYGRAQTFKGLYISNKALLEQIILRKTYSRRCNYR